MTANTVTPDSTHATTLDHRRAPLIEGVQAFVDRDILPFSTPGHKRGASIDTDYAELIGRRYLDRDIPMGGGIDDTHHTGGDTLEAAERLGADAWGADHAFYLVNGSSSGNHALLLAAVRPGDTVIVARDIHKSLLVGLILSGAVPVWVQPRLHPVLEVGLGVHPDDIAAALDRHPDAKLVVLVSPSYCGAPSDLSAIAAVSHARGVPVYVDEAWGPHFHFHPALPPSAMDCGVDAATTSTHKVLGAMTQSSVLLVQGNLIDAARVKTTVGMMVSTSPLALLLASIDACRRQMALHGAALLTETIALANDARARLQAIPGVRVLDAPTLGLPNYDLTKLVIDVDGLGISGFEVEDQMRNRFRCKPEMSDLLSVICLITIGDSPASIDRLVECFTILSREHFGQHPATGSGLGRSSGIAIAPGEQAMSPRDAFFAPSIAVSPDEAVGKVSSELVIPYPPGIPVLAPGDIIPADKIAYLKAGAARGMYVSGPADPALQTIRVVADR